MPEISPIQWSFPNVALTTSPASFVVGRTLNRVGASTNAKKVMPPIQTISASSISNLRNHMSKEV